MEREEVSKRYNCLPIEHRVTSCYMCSKVIDGKENEFDMYGEIVCNDCWDYNQYQALQDMGGI